MGSPIIRLRFFNKNKYPKDYIVYITMKIYIFMILHKKFHRNIRIPFGLFCCGCVLSLILSVGHGSEQTIGMINYWADMNSAWGKCLINLKYTLLDRYSFCLRTGEHHPSQIFMFATTHRESRTYVFASSGHSMGHSDWNGSILSFWPCWNLLDRYVFRKGINFFSPL
jgi:hypothetical protein